MPSYRHHDFGNMYIQFDVKFPEPNFNTPEKLKMLEEILPPRQPSGLPEGAMDVEEVVLADVDPNEQARSKGQGTSTDEDDDHHPHGERVQCASQ